MLLFPPSQLGQAQYSVDLLQELLVGRQEVLQRALMAGSLENMWKAGERGLKTNREGREGRKWRTCADTEYQT